MHIRSLYSNEWLVSEKHADILYKISWLSGITGIIGILSGYVWLGSAVCFGSFFAQMYWIHPTYSMRRTIDIVSVQILLWSHLYVAYTSKFFFLYCVIQLMGVVCYMLSWAYVTSAWISTVFHIGVHASTNISLLLLYLTS